MKPNSNNSVCLSDTTWKRAFQLRSLAIIQLSVVDILFGRSYFIFIFLLIDKIL
jgi:hypothetical protein